VTNATYMDYTFFTALSTFSTVQELGIFDCQFHQNIVQSLVCAFPNLKDLLIRLDRVDGDAAGEDPSCLHKPRLQSLSLRSESSIWPEFLFRWLSSTESFRTIQSLTLHIETTGERATFQMYQFVPALGSHLQHLDLKGLVLAHQGPRENAFRNAALKIDLTRSTSLTTLILRDAIDPTVTSILTQLPSPTILQSLTLLMWFRHDSTISLNSFTALDQMLDSAQFTGLRDVFLVYRGSSHFLLVRHALHRIFRRLSSRGILSVIEYAREW